MKLKPLAISVALALAACTAASKDPVAAPAPTPAAGSDPLQAAAPPVASPAKPIVLTADDSAAPRALTADDNGKTIPLTTDTKTITITLAGNPTTGYSWTLAKIDGKSLDAVGDVAYKPDAAPRGMVGSGGVFVATFDVIAPGKTTITLEYKRPWEKDTPAAKTFTVTIDVAAKP
jgi:predicted secreted protein